jgi:hypothetical protein
MPKPEISAAILIEIQTRSDKKLDHKNEQIHE